MLHVDQFRSDSLETLSPRASAPSSTQSSRAPWRPLPSPVRLIDEALAHRRSATGDRPRAWKPSEHLLAAPASPALSLMQHQLPRFWSQQKLLVLLPFWPRPTPLTHSRTRPRCSPSRLVGVVEPNAADPCGARSDVHVSADTLFSRDSERRHTLQDVFPWSTTPLDDNFVKLLLWSVPTVLVPCKTSSVGAISASIGFSHTYVKVFSWCSDPWSLSDFIVKFCAHMACVDGLSK